MWRSFGLFAIAVGVLDTLLTCMLLAAVLGSPRMNLVLPFLLTIVGAFGIVSALWGYRVVANTRPAANDNPKGGLIANPESDWAETRLLDGCEYRVEYQSARFGRNARPSELRVSISGRLGAEITFSREGWFDRLAKRLSLAREFQTGDVEFDSRVYVRGDAQAFVPQALRAKHRRAAVMELLDIGFSVVVLSTKSIQAVWKHFDPSRQDKIKVAEDAASKLVALSEGLTSDNPEDMLGGNTPRNARFKWLKGTAIAYALLYALTFQYPSLTAFAYLAPAVAAYAIMYFLFAYVAVWMLRGSSTAHDQWAGLVIVAIPLFAFGSLGLVAGINGLGDTTCELRVVTIADKHGNHRLMKRGYYVRVPTRIGSREFGEVTVSRNEHGQIVPGRTQLAMTVCRGRLGIEWVSERSLREPH